MNKLAEIFENNAAWAAKFKADEPEYFAELMEGQKPKYLWIGCADSRVAAELIMGLKPGEVFVHRNIANLVNFSDLSALSVIQYAVEHLKVEHVIVCGHYSCGGVAASVSGDGHGVVDNWIKPIEALAQTHEQELSALEGSAKLDRLAELNVLAQVANVKMTTPVLAARAANQPLEVHGLVHDFRTGLLKQLV